MPRRKLTPAAIATIKLRREAGASLADLAMEFKRSQAQISRIARNISPVKQKRPIDLTKEQKAAALRMTLKERYLTGATVGQGTAERALTGRQQRVGRIKTLMVRRAMAASRRLLNRCLAGQAAVDVHGCRPWQGPVSRRRPTITSPWNRQIDPRKVLLQMRGRVGTTPKARIRYVGCPGNGLDGFCCTLAHMRLPQEVD